MELVRSSFEHIRKLITHMLRTEQSVMRLALAFCLGIFIAFSPFLGLHTLMMIACAWLGRLNFIMMYVGAHVVNNPLTMGFIYWIDYVVGKCILTWFYGSLPADPIWVQWLNLKIAYYTGLPGISFWAFMIGGHVLGLIVSILAYPIVVRLFYHIAHFRASQVSS